MIFLIVFTLLFLIFMVFCQSYEVNYYRNTSNILLTFYKYIASPGRYLCAALLIIHHGYLVIKHG